MALWTVGFCLKQLEFGLTLQVGFAQRATYQALTELPKHSLFRGFEVRVPRTMVLFL